MKEQKMIVDQIRSEYTRQEKSSLDELKALNARVKRPAKVFAYVYGSLSALIMGAGMSLVMTDIGAMLGVKESLPVGVAVGLVGMAMALITYPIYSRILQSRRKKFGDKILALSNQVMEG